MSVFNIETVSTEAVFFSRLLHCWNIVLRERDIMKKVGMIGGDLRNCYLAAMLKDTGYNVLTCGLKESDERLEDVVMQSDYIICATPFSRDNRTLQAPFAKDEILINDLYSALSKEKVFFAGNMSEEVKQHLQNSWIRYYDFLDDEKTTILNIIPTVEGAIELAIRGREETLFGSEILILGYGRIGKYLGRVLQGFGACVSVAARNEKDLTWILLDGNTPVKYEEIESTLKSYDVIFNTVPAMVLKEMQLRCLKKSCKIIDLASKPGGVDFEAAKHYGIDAELALGLPGKVAPKSAAKYMFDFFEKCTNYN